MQLPSEVVGDGHVQDGLGGALDSVISSCFFLLPQETIFFLADCLGGFGSSFGRWRHHRRCGSKTGQLPRDFETQVLPPQCLLCDFGLLCKTLWACFLSNIQSQDERMIP